jgi:hypothetical protein
LKTKKTTVLALLILLSILFPSCTTNVQESFKALTTFPLSQPAYFKIISGSKANTPIEIAIDDIKNPTTYRSGDFTVTAEAIQEVKMTKLKVKILDPDDKSLSFLKSLHVFIATDDTDKIEVAYLDDINSVSDTISLICTSVDLTKYLKAPSFNVSAKLYINETITKDVTVSTDLQFNIFAFPPQ